MNWLDVRTDEWITRQDLLDRTGLPSRTLTYWTSQNVIPSGVRVGRQEMEYPVEAETLVIMLMAAKSQGHHSLATLRLITRCWFEGSFGIVHALTGQSEKETIERG